MEYHNSSPYFTASKPPIAANEILDFKTLRRHAQTGFFLDKKVEWLHSQANNDKKQ